MNEHVEQNVETNFQMHLPAKFQAEGTCVPARSTHTHSVFQPSAALECAKGISDRENVAELSGVYREFF